MKKITLCGFVLLLAMQLRGQASIGTITPHVSAVFDITSDNAGFLAPRMTKVEREAINAPVQGLLVYDTDSKGFFGYTGTKWASLMLAPLWSGEGNDGSANFIGTTDAQALNFTTNNVTALNIATNAQISAGGPDLAGPRVIVKRAADNASYPTVYSEYSGGFGAGSAFPAYFIAANVGSGPVKGNYSFAATEADAFTGNSIAGFSYVDESDGTSGLSFYGGGHPSDGNDRNLERLKITASGNVGIGVASPNAKVEIKDGDMYISDVASGIITRSPNGNCWRTKVNNDGTFSTTTIPCP